jgi:hypothetical protein
VGHDALPPLLDIAPPTLLVQEHGAAKSALMAEKRIDALVAPSDVDGSLRGKARSLPWELARTNHRGGRADKLSDRCGIGQRLPKCSAKIFVSVA